MQFYFVQVELIAHLVLWNGSLLGELALLSHQKTVFFGPCEEKLLSGFHVEAVLRNGEEEDAEADHDDLGDTTKVSEEV